jgi:hypothetical protein
MLTIDYAPMTATSICAATELYLTNVLQAIDARVIARLHGCHFAAVSSQFHKGDSQ